MATVIKVSIVNEMGEGIQIFWSVKEGGSFSCRPGCRSASFCLHCEISNLDVSLKGLVFNISVEAV